MRDAHRQRIALRLPTLAWVVTGASVLWFALAGMVDVARVTSVVGPAGILAILAAQGVVFGVVASAIRREPTGRAVVPAAVAAVDDVDLRIDPAGGRVVSEERDD